VSTVHKAADCIVTGGVIRTMDPKRVIGLPGSVDDNRLETMLRER
jgi:hypothetical protein